jgi:hypothetical protein
MFDNHVMVIVQHRRVIWTDAVDVVSAVILTGLFACRQEDRIVVDAGVERARLSVIVPGLNKKHAGLGACVWLEGVAVQPDYSKDAWP